MKERKKEKKKERKNLEKLNAICKHSASFKGNILLRNTVKFLKELLFFLRFSPPYGIKKILIQKIEYKKMDTKKNEYKNKDNTKMNRKECKKRDK